MSDHLIREVDEEIRREQYKKLWDRFGIYVIALAVLIVAGTAGYRGYQAWQVRQAATMGDQFLTAITAARDEQFDEATATLTTLADGGGSYALLARLRMAGLEAEKGNTEAAIAAFDAIADESSVEGTLRELAMVRAAFLRLDSADYADILSRIEPLTATGKPWRHAAREALALSAYRTAAYAESRKWLDLMVTDASTPQAARTRAGLVLALISGQIGDNDTGSDDGGAAETNG